MKSEAFKLYLEQNRKIRARERFKAGQVAFPRQLAFIEDPARLKALFCTRRAAKSYTAGIYLVQEALAYPNSNGLFVGLTRLSAHGIVWKDILKDLDLKFKIGIKFNETLLTATFPNGSVIYVAGADTDESEMNKLLGKKYRLCVLDEASMYSINLHQLIYGILKPATADQRGTICMMGTSSNLTRGLFYDITTRKEPGWSLHKWTAFDNPHVAKQWAEELDDIDKNRPNFKLTALYRQWYLNEWVVDEEAKVYKFDSGRNVIPCLPTTIEPYRFVMGIDLAHSPDSTSFVIGAYHHHDPALYIVHARKYLKMDITDAALEVKRLESLYRTDVKVVDGANKMAVAEMNNRHGTGLIASDKTGKVDFIRLLNDEFIQGKMMLVGDLPDLVDEYQSLVWITDNGRVVEPRKEHPGIHNDCADAALYMWRYCYSYLVSLPVRPKDMSLQVNWEPEHILKLQEVARKEANPDEFDLMFDKDLFDLDHDDNIGL